MMKLDLSVFLSAAKTQIREDLEKKLKEHADTLVSEVVGRVMAQVCIEAVRFSDDRHGFVVQLKGPNG